MSVLGVHINVGLEESIFKVLYIAHFRLQWIVQACGGMIISIIQLNRCARNLSGQLRGLLRQVDTYIEWSLTDAIHDMYDTSKC